MPPWHHEENPARQNVVFDSFAHPPTKVFNPIRLNWCTTSADESNAKTVMELLGCMMVERPLRPRTLHPMIKNGVVPIVTRQKEHRTVGPITV